jgi:uncharacterized protein YheU (UPF0270 family)
MGYAPPAGPVLAGRASDIALKQLSFFRASALSSPGIDARTLMLIPYDQLEADTLTRLIEDFVTRDGTDNGDDTPLETRVLRVRHALSKGQAVIFFDLESQQCQLMLKHEVPKEFFD